MRAFRIVIADFFYLLPFSRYKRPKRAKVRFFEATSNFYFSSNFDGIFFIGFLSVRAVKVIQPISSISYRFRDIKGFSVECKLTVKHTTLVKHIIVSSILLYQTNCCVKQVLEAFVFLCTFSCQHAAVVSCCACEAPQLFLI